MPPFTATLSRVTSAMRDRVRLRTRLRRLKTLYATPAAPLPRPSPNEIDPARLARFSTFRPDGPGHADVFLRDSQALFGPILTDDEHLTGVLEWLLRSQQITPTGGYSVGYAFAHGWHSDYPETTGYIAVTMWDAFRRRDDVRFMESAVRASDWEIDIQMASGAIRAGYDGDPEGFWQGEIVPAAFNTGQVIQGWNRTFLETGDRRYLDAADRASRWLTTCIDDRGVFVRGLSPGPLSRTRAYYARAAYGLAWTGVLAGQPSYVDAACRHLDWVLDQQSANGWIDHANFGSVYDDDDPLTHTLAYAAEGLLESGLVLKRPGYVDASRKLAVAMMHVCERRGMFLPATITRRLTSADRFSCVPGDAQFACLWLRHGLLSGDLRLISTGLKMVDWLKGVQSLENDNDGIRGGMPGSWPIDGGYSIFFYVNWAAKFFADSLMLAQDARKQLAR